MLEHTDCAISVRTKVLYVFVHMARVRASGRECLQRSRDHFAVRGGSTWSVW